MALSPRRWVASVEVLEAFPEVLEAFPEVLGRSSELLAVERGAGRRGWLLGLVNGLGPGLPA